MVLSLRHAGTSSCVVRDVGNSGLEAGAGGTKWWWYMMVGGSRQGVVPVVT